MHDIEILATDICQGHGSKFMCNAIDRLQMFTLQAEQDPRVLAINDRPRMRKARLMYKKTILDGVSQIPCPPTCRPLQHSVDCALKIYRSIKPVQSQMSFDV